MMKWGPFSQTLCKGWAAKDLDIQTNMMCMASSQQPKRDAPLRADISS